VCWVIKSSSLITWTDSKRTASGQSLSRKCPAKTGRCLHLELDDPLALVGSDGYELGLLWHEVKTRGWPVYGERLRESDDRYDWLIFVQLIGARSYQGRYVFYTCLVVFSESRTILVGRHRRWFLLVQASTCQGTTGSHPVNSTLRPWARSVMEDGAFLRTSGMSFPCLKGSSNPPWNLLALISRGG